MEQETIFLTIVGMMLATYIPRLLPVWALSSRSLPKAVGVWLRCVPVAVLAAMLFPAIVVQQGRVDLSPNNLFLLAAIPTLLVAWKTRSLFGSVIVGAAVVAVARYAIAL